MWHLGVDIGGTFTDFVLSRPDGTVVTDKRLTTPRDPSAAVLEGARSLLAREGAALKGLPGRINHGTTLITNAIVERRGAKTGVLTTHGFRDVLEIRREGRYDLYDLAIAFSDPLAPRERRLEVEERLDASGAVHAPLNPDSTVEALRRLKEAGVESLAVVLLHAYRNPVHEDALLELAARELPGVPVSLSSRVCPEIREYERTSTTVANAYVQPITEGYLDRLVHGLKAAAGEHGAEPVHVSLIQSDGGVLSPEEAARIPIRLVESGPAGGVMAAARFQEYLGQTGLLSFDMGGTTAKMAFLDAAGPRYTRDFEVDRRHFYRRGSGLPLLIPAMDLVEIGAGGGSYASLSPLGTVQVGPESAGSEPGPCAYGLGGDRPTVTDADVVLGLLNPDYFLGGAMALHAEAAEAALARTLSKPLKLSPLQAAEMVYQTVTANMADATRVHAAEHGVDLSANTLIAFGGAGPVHAWGLARQLRIGRIVFPGHAGVESALGFLAAAESYEAGRTVPRKVEDLSAGELRAILSALEAEAAGRLSSRGQTSARHSVSMRFRGQGAEITVPVPRDQDPQSLKAAFLKQYRALYGHVVEHIPIEAVTWRVRVEGPRPAVPLFDALAQRPGDCPAPAPQNTRRAWNPDRAGAEPTPVYRTSQLEPGMVIPGPAILEDPYSTVVLGRGRARVLAGNTLVAELDGEDNP